MTTVDLVDRLTTLPHLAGIPRGELAWLATHGRLEAHAAGAVVAPKGERIRTLWILLSGRIAVRVDRGTGPRRVIVWQSGEVSGMLPYSRMTGPPGDNYCEEATELLTIDEQLFPDMITKCPAFTTHAVHLMLDRARGFNASDLQDEKLMSLGRLAAGLAHELNNPASAAVRGAGLLRRSMADADASLGAIAAAGPTRELFDAIARTRMALEAKSDGAARSPLERADREDEIAGWLEQRGLDTTHAAVLADTAVTLEALDALASVAGGTLAPALGWIAADCETRAMAGTIEQAATRVYELVGAVKRFTYMDHLAGPAAVEIEPGLRDTIKVLGAKTGAKGAVVTLDIEPDLPRVRATGGDLNQVWFSLIDNAIDAIARSGHVAISASRVGDGVVVRVVDDGPGIPADIVPRIFDPFFTTKPPGQGTGLGLAIARQLLHAHHGDITVQSAPGQTEFVVTLAADQAEAIVTPRPAGS